MKILVINHSCSRTGAPLVLLYFLEWLKTNHPNIDFDVLSFGPGPLEINFSNLANNHFKAFEKKHILYRSFRFFLRKAGILKQHESTMYEYELQNLGRRNYDLIYNNSVVQIEAATQIKKYNPHSKLILHVHELDTAIQKYVPQIRNLLIYIDLTIAASNLVRKNLITSRGFKANKVETIYEFSKIKDFNVFTQKTNNTIYIGGAGFVQRRKGIDAFIHSCSIIKSLAPDFSFKFLWMGKVLDADKAYYEDDLRKLEIEKEFEFLNEQSNPTQFFKKIDFLWMTSREDPFPLVCIEAAYYSVPILLFDKATGTQEAISDLDYLIAPYLDSYSLAEKTLVLIKDKTLYRKTAVIIKERFSEFTIENQSQKIWEQINKTLKGN